MGSEMCIRDRVPDGDVVNGSGVESGALKPVAPPHLDSNARGKMTDS